MDTKSKSLYLRVRGNVHLDRVQKIVTIPKESSIEVGDTVKVVKAED